LRQLVVPPYRILYELANDTVTILAIVYGRTFYPDDEDDSTL